MGNYLSSITEQWLLVAPKANPSMLEIFRDRDVSPLREMVPWAGEFAGKYLTGASKKRADAESVVEAFRSHPHRPLGYRWLPWSVAEVVSPDEYGFRGSARTLGAITIS